MRAYNANPFASDLRSRTFVSILGPVCRQVCANLGCNLEYRVDCVCKLISNRCSADLYCRRAGLSDGHSILELGCGWGSFSLFAAAKFPKSSVTAVSNSRTQKEFIENKAKERGLTNIQVNTPDKC